MFRVIASTSIQDLNPEDLIDTSSTGVSFYDSFLDDKYTNYLNRTKNLVGTIEYLTPREYYEACAEIFNSTVQSLVAQRRNDPDSLDWLLDRIENGHKFPLPYVNYAQKGQEGLHRMLILANNFGWDNITFPVLVVRYANERRTVVDEAYKILDHAIQESIQYRYLKESLPDDLVTEIQWHLDSDDENEYTAKCIDESSEEYIFSLISFESEIAISVDKSSLRYKSSDDFEIDDSDIDISDMDIDALLKNL